YWCSTTCSACRTALGRSSSAATPSSARRRPRPWPRTRPTCGRAASRPTTRATTSPVRSPTRWGEAGGRRLRRDDAGRRPTGLCRPPASTSGRTAAGARGPALAPGDRRARPLRPRRCVRGWRQPPGQPVPHAARRHPHDHACAALTRRRVRRDRGLCRYPLACSPRAGSPVSTTMTEFEGTLLRTDRSPGPRPGPQGGEGPPVRPYEVMVILDAGLEEDAIRAAVDRSTELIRSRGGVPGRVDRWGKRRFAYELGHRWEGYY